MCAYLILMCLNWIEYECLFIKKRSIYSVSPVIDMNIDESQNFPSGQSNDRFFFVATAQTWFEFQNWICPRLIQQRCARFTWQLFWSQLNIYQSIVDSLPSPWCMMIRANKGSPELNHNNWKNQAIK